MSKPKQITITHLDFHISVVFGNKSYTHDHQHTAHYFAKEQGYKFEKVEKIDNHAVETWSLKDAI